MGHWYSETGNPLYTLKGSNGKERDTTLRDARKLFLSPSVTTITGVPAKPQLIQWQQEQLFKAILNSNIHVPDLELDSESSIKQWKGMIVGKSQEITKEAARRGNEIHNKLEGIYKGLNSNDLGIALKDPFIHNVIDYMEKILPETKWVSEASFHHRLGFGGKVDLHSLYNNGIILDFKTKGKTADFTKKLGYDEHCMQLAAYRHGLGISEAKCFNLFISTETPGLIKHEEWSEQELERGWEMFKSLLRYWQLSNNHFPRE